MRRWLTRVLLLAALLAPAPYAFADAVVVQSNSSEDGEASSGDADASNTSDGSAGARSEDSAEARQITGPASGGSVQDGDNETESEQTADARTGDGVAASQVSGAVVGPGGSATIDNSNTSDGAEAHSGDADAANVGSVEAGPRVAGVGACPDAPVPAQIDGPVGACIVQEGDNAAELAQGALGETGDAVAGAQITGAVVAAGGSADIANTNSSEDDEATSGDASAANAAAVFAGPEVVGPDGDALTAAAIEGPIAARIVQDGDNEHSVDQGLETRTGDAVAGGQITGVVTAGDTAVAVDNTSEDGESTTGDAAGANDLVEGRAGPVVPVVL